MKWRIQKRRGKYFVEKEMTKVKVTGSLWWKKKEEYKSWETVDLWGREWIMYAFAPIPPMAKFSSKKKAERFLKDLLSEPKTVFEA